MGTELTLPSGFESEGCGACGASLYARRPRAADAIQHATRRDVVIACIECEAVHCVLDGDNPEHAAEIAEATAR